MDGQEPGQGKGYCAQKWCYVDPCKCNIEISPKTMAHEVLPKTSPYLPGARFQDRPIYYSYATCGGNDEYTSSRGGEACINRQTEESCKMLPKCGWHVYQNGQGQCMGKELIGTCKKVAKCYQNVDGTSTKMA